MTIYDLIGWIYKGFLVIVVILAMWNFFETKKLVNKVATIIVVVLFLLRIFGIK